MCRQSDPIPTSNALAGIVIGNWPIELLRQINLCKTLHIECTVAETIENPQHYDEMRSDETLRFNISINGRA